MHAHAINQPPDDARVLLVGAGVAGVSAALWFHDLEVPFRWIDAAPCPGGTLRRIHHPIRNVAGRRWPNGTAFADALVTQLAEEGLTPEYGVTLTQLDPERGDVTLEATTTRYPAVVLATGTRPRRLGVPHEQRFEGRGVYRSTNRWASTLTGGHAVVVGGGDGGCEGALILARAGVQVTLVHRRDTFRARSSFVEAVLRDPQITQVMSSQVIALLVDQDQLVGVVLDTPSGEQRVDTTALFVKLGVEPALPALTSTLRRGERGYVWTDARRQTSAAATWAIGDLVRAQVQTIACALADGALVAAALA